MPCDLDDSGFCFKCTGDSLQINHCNTCFQNPSSDSTSSPSGGTIPKFTLCTYNVGYNVKVDKVLKFLRDDAPDIVCIQEMMNHHVKILIERLRKSIWSKYTHCGRSPESRAIILAKVPVEEVSRGFLGSSGVLRNNQFVTVKVAGFYLTSLHLSARDEETRMKQLRKLKDKSVWDTGRHIWAGDFNSRVSQKNILSRIVCPA